MAIDSFVGEWYKKSFGEICQTFVLKDFQSAKIPNKYSTKCPLLSESRVLGATEDLESYFENDSIICGGPCIDDSHYDISLESAFEIASLIKVGKVLKKKVIIHLGIQEEILREEQSEESIKKWIAIGDRYEKFIEQMKKAIGHENVFCCRSDRKEINEKIIEYASELQKIFSYEDARTLYQHLSANGKPIQKDSFNFNIHTRFLALYLPDFIEKVAGVKDAKLLVYEDLQQVMAVKKGNAFAVLRNKFNNGPAQIITLPYPGFDGKSRMHRFDRARRPYLHSEKELIASLCKEMPKDVLEFNLKNWPEELTKAELKNADQLAEFFLTLKGFDSK